MPKLSSPQKWLVGGMRWVARVISVLWGYVAVFLTLFMAANYQIEGFFGSTVAGFIVAVGLLMFMGAAILASVWKQEAIGGGLLLFDGAVSFAAFVSGLLPHLETRFVEFFMPSTPGFWLFTPVVWTPIVAGALFLACHWISKGRGVERPQEQPSETGEMIVENSPDAGLRGKVNI